MRRYAWAALFTLLLLPSNEPAQAHVGAAPEALGGFVVPDTGGATQQASHSSRDEGLFRNLYFGGDDEDGNCCSDDDGAEGAALAFLLALVLSGTLHRRIRSKP